MPQRQIEFEVQLLRSGKRQKEVAEAINKSRAWMSYVVSGERRPAEQDLEKIADVLGVPKHAVKLRAR